MYLLLSPATRVAHPTAHPPAGTPVVLASPNHPPSSTAEVVIMQGVDTGGEHVPVPFTIVRSVPDHSLGTWSGDGVLQTPLGNTLLERIN